LLVGELATQHQIDIGRRRIAFIGAASFSPTNDRQSGYLAVLARAGLKAPSRGVVRLPQNEESNHVLGAQFMRQLLKLKPRPDAVFCYNDPTALGVTLAILEAGLRVPEDIAIVGCGNSVHNDFFRVPLTSVDLGSAHMGREAANLALRAIRERAQKAGHAPIAVLLRPTLVVRESTTFDARLGDRPRPR